MGALLVLFQQYGPPLLLKSDNEFNTEKSAEYQDDAQRSALRRLAALERWKIEEEAKQLFSSCHHLPGHGIMPPSKRG